VGGRRLPLRGFTLIELLVAMAVIAVLAVLLLGVVVRARQIARDSTCKSALSQMWRAVNFYANDHRDILFLNLATPLQVSNLLYDGTRPTGWGHIFPKYVADERIFFCPCDPMRDPEWQYGWRNWESAGNEVRGSYGYRGRQGLVVSAAVPLTLATLDRNPQKVVGCDFYGDVTAPPKTHHPSHINVLRCNGSVGRLNALPTFGPQPEHFVAALAVIDR
jgi:prepilin-type N-terminal cleavage/methylation domain-containing protein